MKYKFEFVVGSSKDNFSKRDAIKLVKGFIHDKGENIVDEMTIYARLE